LSVLKTPFYPKKHLISSHTAKNRSCQAKNHSHTNKKAVGFALSQTIAKQLSKKTKKLHIQNQYFKIAQ
jgi:cytoplasmic iron level regulating protein YaaA (DUF328/UPF0246 family)